MRIVVGHHRLHQSREMPKFNSISISGYHMHEAGRDGGAGACLHACRRAWKYVARRARRGSDIDAFAPRLSFFFGIGMNLFMEVAKLRRARTLGARS
jgi:methylmalonyl-CoA mutase